MRLPTISGNCSTVAGSALTSTNLGAAGCVDVAGLTICGISGIYKSHDYRLDVTSRCRTTQAPYDPSIIHARTTSTDCRCLPDSR